MQFVNHMMAVLKDLRPTLFTVKTQATFKYNLMCVVPFSNRWENPQFYAIYHFVSHNARLASPEILPGRARAVCVLPAKLGKMKS